MSQENVDIVREVMARVRRTGAGEPEPRLFELAPEVELDMSRRIFNPDVYEGHDGLRRFKWGWRSSGHLPVFGTRPRSETHDTSASSWMRACR
jgi:hypothetical protein